MVARLTRRSLPFIAFGGLIAACASGGTGDSFDSGSGNSGINQGGQSQGLGMGSSSVGAIGSDSGQGIGNNVGTMDASMVGMGEGCQHFDVMFTPRIPLVYVLTDGSGSVFDNNPDGGQNDWATFRTAALSVIQSLQSQVDFGWGEFASNGTTSAYTTAGYAAASCGVVASVPIAANNYSAINTDYSSINVAYGNMPGATGKTNTPAFLALGQAGTSLQQAAAQIADAGVNAIGGEYILFVTDGETDFCDDGDAVCPIDAVTAEIQKLYGEGVTTLVLGEASTINGSSSSAGQIYVEALQDFANAGAGVTPALPNPNPGQTPTQNEFYEQCNSGGWAALYTAAGSPASQSLATYVAPGAAVTNATVYSPTSGAVSDLTAAITTALQTVKSCSFDLQGQIMVDLANASEGSVSIDGASIPYVGDSGTDGWMMSTSTELDLVGSACDTWRSTGKNISFDFPCQILLPIPPK